MAMGGTPEMRKMRGVTLGKAPEKNVEISNYVTSPPSETASDLADFQSRHGEAPRFAGKGREIALVDAGWDDTKVVHPNGCGQARRTSQRGSYPLAGGSDDPPSKTRTPPPTQLVFHQLQVPLTCIQRAFFALAFLTPRYV
jgi:hypothetical protein